MNPNHQHKKKKTLPDFSLLISRLEKQIIHQKDQSKTFRVLKDDRIWKVFGVDQQIKLANLAQMAGELDTACRVLSYIHQTSPDVVEAWQNHLELLSVLDKKEKIAQVLACSRKFVAKEVYNHWVKSFSVPGHTGSEEDVQAASLPFERLRYRQRSIGRYLELFSGREDCFARQWVDKPKNKQGYVPVRRSLEPQDLEDHFKGHKTYGMYLLKSDGSVKTAVIDVDLRKDFREKNLKSDDRSLVKRELYYCIERIAELSEQAGLRPLIEFSGGKGYHFWYFFEIPVKPQKARPVLGKIKQAIAGDLSAFTIEVFPKQDHLRGKGLGNLVKLPLGVHRLTGKRSYFIKCHNQAIEAQLDFLSKVELADPEKLNIVDNGGKDKMVFIHPRWEKWAKSYPELYALESKCPPLSQIIAACRNAKSLTVREEKILFQTIGFLPRSKTLLHHLLSSLTDYNPHLVDYKLSRIRGTPLGCRRIHSLLSYTGDLCHLEISFDYQHPLLHLDEWKCGSGKKSEKVEYLSSALENLKTAIIRTQRFIE